MRIDDLTAKCEDLEEANAELEADREFMHRSYQDLSKTSRAQLAQEQKCNRQLQAKADDLRVDKLELQDRLAASRRTNKALWGHLPEELKQRVTKMIEGDNNNND